MFYSLKVIQVFYIWYQSEVTTLELLGLLQICNFAISILYFYWIIWLSSNVESLISDNQIHSFCHLWKWEHWHTSAFTWRANTPLHIGQEENPLRVEGRNTSAYSGGPSHILILMGVSLIPVFRLCNSGLSYQRVIGLIGCGPGIMVLFLLLSKQQRIGTCFDCMSFPKYLK